MFCEKCGKEIDKNSDYCKFCGAAQQKKHRKSFFDTKIFGLLEDFEGCITFLIIAIIIVVGIFVVDFIRNTFCIGWDKEHQDGLIILLTYSLSSIAVAITTYAMTDKTVLGKRILYAAISFIISIVVQVLLVFLLGFVIGLLRLIPSGKDGFSFGNWASSIIVDILIPGLYGIEIIASLVIILIAIGYIFKKYFIVKADSK